MHPMMETDHGPKQKKKYTEKSPHLEKQFIFVKKKQKIKSNATPQKKYNQNF